MDRRSTWLSPPLGTLPMDATEGRVEGLIGRELGVVRDAQTRWGGSDSLEPLAANPVLLATQAKSGGFRGTHLRGKRQLADAPRREKGDAVSLSPGVILQS